jgi:hypothetical protein
MVRTHRQGNMTIIKGLFLEGEKITVRVGNDLIVRKVKYNKRDGLYFIYQYKKYFEYEF